MSLETGFLVYGMLFWAFIAILIAIFSPRVRDHFTRRISEPLEKRKF